MVPGLHYPVPVCQALEEDAARRILELVLILASLFLLDIVTTEIILLMGGIELNPFMVAVVAHPVIHLALKGAILAVIVIVALVAEMRVQGSGVFFYCLLITMYIFVVVNNVFVILPQVLA
ncbi:hypothetical protein Metfor_0852 [Methanoregula formicica SMSP]|uniref:DUF5658 domain-containing protein n=2 Tax=Methanoregula formicica TaxID=882104 RepID=L0HFQ0_METFS|nr:hypothetical protein Metfor_0852 [Methanoregula formicica SMSP]